jgi:hypothetical protein
MHYRGYLYPGTLFSPGQRDIHHKLYENTNICSKFVIFQKNTKLLLSDEKSLNLGNMQGGAI